MVHPHTFWGPPPPQVSGETHAPQLSVPPHPSEIGPQFLDWQLVLTQPHTFEVTAPQVSGSLHGPQFSVPPQASAGVPQSFPSAEQVVAVHPQTF